MQTYYDEYPMALLCGLSTIPDSILAFPLVMFVYEYNKERARKLAKHGGNFKLTKRKVMLMILKIAFRVIKNPIIWGSVFGAIINFAVLQQTGSVPAWLMKIVTAGSNAILCTAMFTLGDFAFAFFISISSHILLLLLCFSFPSLFVLLFSQCPLSASHD